MRSLSELEREYDILREKDRLVASLMSKQRMVPVFRHLFDESAQATVDAELTSVLETLRQQARELAVELARMAFVELDLQDLSRISTRMRAFERWLDEQPAERLDCCRDLLTFLGDRRALADPKPPSYDD